ncbi:MAG: 4-amino-4-deoxychorismate lyase [Actinobacteria bacterium]|nr:MAG: 4-amino-4-deoxychorismate lyase [Actinomycetota bacterium]
MNKVWVNGDLVDVTEATVSVFDHGLTVGDGVFETLKTYGGRPFAVRRHLERLATSAAGLGLTAPAPEVLRTAMEEVVAANGVDDGALRITCTGGRGPLGSARGDSGQTLIVASAALAPWPLTTRVAVVPWPRNERGAVAGLKTTSYAENVVALGWAHQRGAGEALFLNLAGNVCEGTGSNVFVAVGGRLVTPPLSAGCLAGVTRALVLEAGDAVEADVTVADLERASEAFLASTTREVQPIGDVDGRPLPSAPGPLTEASAAALAALVASDLDP